MPLSKIILDNPFKSIFNERDVGEFQISIEDFNKSKENVKQRLAPKLINGKCSEVLLRQFARHNLQAYEKLGNEIYHFHLATMLDTIEQVENNRTANIRSFNKKPLFGLRHIHHNANTFVVRNVVNHWKEKCKNKDEIAFQNQLLKVIFDDLTKDYPPEIANRRAVTILLAKIMNESKFRDFGKQTGEWIVFGQIDNTNYYLCLATHKEAKDFTDQIIFDRLAPCLIEFPQLKALLRDSG